MDHDDAILLRELTSRVGGHRLQRRFIELVWRRNNHSPLRSVLPVLLDNLDELEPETLTHLVGIMEKYKSDVINNWVLVSALKNSGGEVLKHWIALMGRHFDLLGTVGCLGETELSESVRISLIDILFKYHEAGFTALSREQEYALLIIGAMNMNASHPAITNRSSDLSYHAGFIKDADLTRYVIGNVKQIDAIARLVTEDKLFRPAHIQVRLEGMYPSLAAGAL